MKKAEKRNYIRLNSVFPVEFEFVEGEKVLISWSQGFTKNISFGGIALEARFIKEDLRNLLGKEIKFFINIPLNRPPIVGRGTVRWAKKIPSKPSDIYVMGVEFTEISEKERKRLVRYARIKKILPKLSVLIICFLIFISGYLFVKVRLSYLQTKKLLKSYIEKVENLKRLKNSLYRLNNEFLNFKKMYEAKIKKAKELELKYKALESELDFYRQKLISVLDTKGYQDIKEKIKEKETKLKDLQKKILLLKIENEKLRDKLCKIALLKSKFSADLFRLKQKIVELKKINISYLYNWIKNRQNLRTGLVFSFEGDPFLKNIAFTYDQALCVCEFLIFKDFDRAKRILDFYNKRAKTSKEGAFFNAYYSDTGNVAEYITHTGPNAWIGIAVLQYIKFTGDRSYLNLAKRIAEFLLKMQDEEGGFKGCPKCRWYSTEHNLDCYAFFNMLYELTQDDFYKGIRDKVFRWLKKYSYTKSEIPINRGKGDSTIATDTYAWSIAAIGPERLERINMDPFQIIDFAEKNCKVKVRFKTKDRDIEVEGFDFALYRNLPRGGVISCEWTAQMVLAFKIMSNYYYEKKDYEKALYFLNKANYFLNELQKMIIISPSPTGQGKWCLPYASADFVDTGHGWRTPRGKTTGSVSATCYFLFSQLDFNPLKFSPPIKKEVYGLLKEKKYAFK